jgi:hypothetical protein
MSGVALFDRNKNLRKSDKMNLMFKAIAGQDEQRTTMNGGNNT